MPYLIQNNFKTALCQAKSLTTVNFTLVYPAAFLYYIQKLLSY